MVNRIFKIARSVFRKIQKSLELNKYNDFTIADHFRKQGAIIGEYNRIEVRDLGAEPFLVRIGNHCTIAPNVNFLCHDGATWLFTDEIPSLQKFSTIEILDNCFIGMNATLLGSITIGPNSIVGTASVVTKDVPPNTVVAGNPARVICSIDEYKKKVLQIWEQQKPPGYFACLKSGKQYSPLYIQQLKTEEYHKLKKHLSDYLWDGKRTKK